MAASYNSTYVARVDQSADSGHQLMVTIPQVFQSTSIPLDKWIGRRPVPSEMGYVSFLNGDPTWPVWHGAQLTTNSDGTGAVEILGGGSFPEVWVGPHEPSDPDYIVWYDTDEVVSSGSGGGGTGIGRSTDVGNDLTIGTDSGLFYNAPPVTTYNANLSLASQTLTTARSAAVGSLTYAAATFSRVFLITINVLLSSTGAVDVYLVGTTGSSVKRSRGNNDSVSFSINPIVASGVAGTWSIQVAAVVGTVTASFAGAGDLNWMAATAIPM